jgi:polar amino acid transport system ATP-binding protein
MTAASPGAAAPPPDYLIRVQNITKRFGDRVVLDDLSFDIRAGETIALLGPSGGGKSTLLRCINGLNDWNQGQVQVGPHTLCATSASSSKARNGEHAVRDVRLLMGMIFQDFQLFPHLTALQNVMEAPIRVQRVKPAAALQRARELLDRVGLADRADAYPDQLSGGQKQRVAIARAVAMQPRGLLCDEITSALDPELKDEVLAVLEDLKRDGLTLVMVTHEIGFARRAADRVLVLADGKIIEDGPPSQVLDNPQTARTRQFLSRVLG